MTEREKQELGSQFFPRVLKETVDDFIKNVWSKPDMGKKKIIKEGLEEIDPHLNQMIEECSLIFPQDREGVRVGAYLMYEILKNIEPRLPIITEQTAEALRQEYKNFGVTNELTNPTLNPYDYAEENPSLMLWVATLPEESMLVGGMLVYELKRRQHHSNRLSEKFGI